MKITQELQSQFEERFSQCETYVGLIEGLDSALKNGNLSIAGTTRFVVSTDQQRILYSGVYLHLYNLVEATMTSCLELVSKAVTEETKWRVKDLSEDLKREWVKYVAQTNLPLANPERRLEYALALCDHLLSALPVEPFEIAKGGTGNWHEDEIYRIARRVGFELKVETSTLQGVKKPVRDGLGAMKLVVEMRNKLAHGAISFVECSRNDTPQDLRNLLHSVRDYMRDVVASFSQYVIEHQYLNEKSRPSRAS